ncbi:MAG: hypothetical protein IKR56_09800, partial [Lachnospiraceae bacterium]|nr:hypothetical protein [Lachnospiraceae bacterium]
MRKKMGSRIALVSALTMLAVEALSPVAVIAAEDGAAESEYVEAVSVEGDEAEVEEAQDSDIEETEVNGEEEITEEDINGEALEASINLTTGQIFVGEQEGNVDGKCFVEEKSIKDEWKNDYNYRVVNIKTDGTYTLYVDDTSTTQDLYVDIASGVNATIMPLDLSVDNYGLGRAAASNEGVDLGPVIKCGDNTHITLTLPGGMDTSTTHVTDGFISQIGKKSVIDVIMQDDYDDIAFYMAGNDPKRPVIYTEGTLNVKFGGLDFGNPAENAICAPGGTVNVTGGFVYINQPGEAAVLLEDGTFNMESGQFTISELEHDGICAPGGSVNINGGVIDIDASGFESACGIWADEINISGGDTRVIEEYWPENGDLLEAMYYGKDTPGAIFNTISEKTEADGTVVKELRKNIAVPEITGIMAGTVAKTIKFADGKHEDIVVPGKGSFKMTGGELTIDTRDTGHIFKKNGGRVQIPVTDSGLYIIGAPSDALHSGGDIEISGGKIGIGAAYDAISAESNVSITDEAKVEIFHAYNGIQGQTVNIGKKDDLKAAPAQSPDITLGYGYFDDGRINKNGNILNDGIHAAEFTRVVTFDSYEELERSEGESGYTAVTTVSGKGGKLNVYSGKTDVLLTDDEYEIGEPDEIKAYGVGSGVNCFGDLNLWGGELSVTGHGDMNEPPLNRNEEFLFCNGPVVFGAGVYGKGQSIPSKGAGVYLVWGAPENADSKTTGALGAGDPFSFIAGEKFRVEDSKGQLIYETTLRNAGNFIIFGHPTLKDGEKYKVKVGDGEPKEMTGLRKDEVDPEPEPDEDEPDPTKPDDGTISVNNVCGYTVSYNSSISYNGAKIYLPYFVFDGAKVGGTISNNTIIFKKIKYKNNKFVGTAQMRLQFKAAKTKKDGTKFSKEEKAKIKAEVKKLNDYFKKNYLTFEIVPRQLLANE